MPEKSITYSFNKSEKLCSRNFIDELFSGGKSIYFQSFKLIYLYKTSKDNTGFRVLISVPKKYIKLAVGRNKIKRLIRESFRLNKHPLTDYLTRSNQSCDLAIIYSSKKIPSFAETQIAINSLLKRLIQINEENHR